MDTKVHLLQEQYDEILKNLQKLEEENRKDIEQYDIINFSTISGGKCFGDTPDYHSIQQIQAKQREIEEYKKLLENSVIVGNIDFNRVDIGTTFTATMDFGDGEIESADYTLVTQREQSICSKNNSIYISVDSEFGKAVFGKGLMEGFMYQSNGMEIVGFVEDIEEKVKVKSL